MERRTFLRSGAVAGLAALASRVAADSGSGASAVPAFELAEVGIDELQAGLAAGRFTARALALAYLERIDVVDRSGPTLRSIIETNPDALGDRRRARRRAARRKGARGPLHGIPVLLKDNIDTADRMTTTAGSLALEGSIARPRTRSSPERLREAGAVILRQDEPERVGQLPLHAARRAAGAGAAASAATRTRSTATRAARARARAPRRRPACAPPRSAPRPTARSSARRRLRPGRASSRRSAW